MTDLYVCKTCKKKYGMRFTMRGIKKAKQHEKRNKGHKTAKEIIRLVETCGTCNGCNTCFNKSECYPFMFDGEEIDIIAPMNYFPVLKGST